MSAVSLPVQAAGVILVMLFSSISPSLAQAVFQRTYGGASGDVGSSVQQTSDDGYIITGSTGSFGSSGSDVYLIKTNSLGDTLWTRTYGGASGDGGSSVRQTSDGGYIITGVTDLGKFGSGYVYLIKTNSLGDTLWTRTFRGAGFGNGFSVEQTSDGGYIITGYTYSFGAGGSDVYLLRTDSLGDTLWTRTYGGAFDDEGYSVQQTSDGGYIITGLTYSFGRGFSDVYLIRTGSVGDTLWTRTYGGASWDNGFSLQQTSDGGYIITGRTYSFGAGFYDVYLIKTNSVGNTLWTRTYGGGASDVGSSVQQTSDGGYIITGSTESFGAGEYDVYLIKTDPNGIVTGVTDNSLGRIPSELLLKQNYPNPFNPSTTISYELPAENWVSLKVYNLFGQEVATLAEEKQEAGFKTLEWNATGLSSGVYFSRLRAGSFTETRQLLLLK